MPDTPENQPHRLDPKDLLLADLEYFGAELARSEEQGEKRLNFFVSLVTAVAAGLGALAATDHRLGYVEVRTITIGAIGALLALGFMTWLRMLRRNLVSDSCMETCDMIRARYAARAGLAGYEVPVPVRRKLWRGGYAQTVATLEAVLAAALVAVLAGGAWLPLATFAVVLAALLGVGAWARREAPEVTER